GRRARILRRHGARRAALRVSRRPRKTASKGRDARFSSALHDQRPRRPGPLEDRAHLLAFAGAPRGKDAERARDATAHPAAHARSSGPRDVSILAGCDALEPAAAHAPSRLRLSLHGPLSGGRTALARSRSFATSASARPPRALGG